jgi:hypothetical protein
MGSWKEKERGWENVLCKYGKGRARQIMRDNGERWGRDGKILHMLEMKS